MNKRTGLTVSKEFMEKLKSEYEKRKVELREKGIYSPTSLVIHIVNEWLKNNPPRFTIVNHNSNTIHVLDREINMVADVYFSYPDHVFCSICHTNNCIHIIYVLSQKDVVEALKKNSWIGDQYLD